MRTRGRIMLALACGILRAAVLKMSRKWGLIRFMQA